MSRKNESSHISLYRGNLNFRNKHLSGDKKKNKIDFKKKKDNVIKSLDEVELFLNNIKDFSRYIKLYKLFK